MATTPFSVCKEFCAGGGGASDAKNVKYDNKKSGLAADNVGDAIDEICANMDDIDTSKNWNQNDPKEADYIKNRPFYEDGEKVKQLEDKFIPNTIARTADVDKKMNEAAENVDNKIAESLVPFEELKIKPTAQGSLIPRPDSAEAPLQGMKIFGKTKQATTTGKNKFDANTVYSEYKQADGSFSATSGVTNNIIKNYFGEDMIGKTVTISAMLKKTDANQNYIALRIHKSDGSYIKGSEIKSNNVFEKTSLTYMVSSKDDYWNITYGNLASALIEFKDLQVEEGAVSTPYEPYTGGMPSPSSSYPQEPENDGDKGSIELFVKGSNLFDYASHVANQHYSEIPVVGGKTIYRNGNIGNSALWVIYDISGNVLGDFGTFGFTASNPLVLPNDAAYIKSTDPGYDPMKTLYIGYCRDNTYEPYKSQSLTIPTPNGLHGIPTSSGGNYTDENGQQYVSDYKDYERMVYVQRVKFDYLSSPHTIGQHDNGVRYVAMSSNGGATSANTPIMCNQYIGGAWSNIANHIYIASGGSIVVTDNRFTDLATAKEIISTEKPMVLYPLAEPIETPLSEEEIASYKALHTNYPNTTIYNDEGAYTEVKYVADTKNYVDNKIANEVAKLTAAIITE